ncbi:unnamed protein product [Symbiodinium sp. CCMP2456]|nr:unnamed protein product [Symbiodinium sp. CCMP2456]
MGAAIFGDESGDVDYDLRNPEDLINFLIDANIRLVRLSYLLELNAAGRLWPRRQEAEEQGLVRCHEIECLKRAEYVVDEKHFPPVCGGAFVRQRRDTGAGEGRVVRIYSVSHCWEAQQHPDPFGFQAHLLLKWFRETRDFSAFGKNDPDQCWLFIDFISLPQYKRTEAEEQQFRHAMNSMHLLYSHSAIYHVIRLEKIMPAHLHRSLQRDFIEIYCETTNKVELRPFAELVMNDTLYFQRGWCVAETQWMCTRSVSWERSPMTPAMFQERVIRGMEGDPDGLVLIFTHRSDLESVVQLQEKVFRKHAQHKTVLYLYNLPDTELQVLAETLPSLVSLQVLIVQDVDQEHERTNLRQSLAALAASMPKCKELFYANAFGVDLLLLGDPPRRSPPISAWCNASHYNVVESHFVTD